MHLYEMSELFLCMQNEIYAKERYEHDEGRYFKGRAYGRIILLFRKK